MEGGVDNPSVAHQVGNVSLTNMQGYRRSTVSTTKTISSLLQGKVNNQQSLGSSSAANLGLGNSSLSGATLQLLSNIQGSTFSICDFNINLCDKTENTQ